MAKAFLLGLAAVTIYWCGLRGIGEDHYNSAHKAARKGVAAGAQWVSDAARD